MATTTTTTSAGRPMCPKGHPLTQRQQGNYVCDECQKSSSKLDSLQCEKCDYDVCFTCAGVVKAKPKSEEIPATMTDVAMDSKVSSVVVYQDRAQVFRTGKVSFPSGTARLLFEDLPSNLDRDSLQVALNSTDSDADNVVLKGISFETVEVENKDYGSETDVKVIATKKVEELQDESHEMNDELTRISHRKKFMEQCFNKAVSTNNHVEEETMVNTDNWENLVEGTIDAQSKDRKKKREIERKAKLLDKEHHKLQLETGKLVEKKKKHQAVAVTLTSPLEVRSLAVQISYVVNNAGWDAAYDIRVDSNTNEMQITYNGVVWQSTEENWEDIQLELSTAKPAISGKQPQLSPWRVHLAAPVPKKSRKSHGLSGCSSSSVRMMREAEMDEDEEESIDEATFAAPRIEQASVNEGAVTAVTFSVPRTHTLKNDSQTIRVALVQFPLDTEIHYVTVPRKAEYCFAQAKTKNTSEFVLIAGSSSIFLNQQFISQGSMERVAPSESFTIHVGIDEGVPVTRKLLRKLNAEEGGWVSSKKTKVNYQFRITVKNHKSGSIQVDIQEALPVSMHSDIIVEIKEPLYKEDKNKDKGHIPYLKKDDEGIYYWHLDLAKGETKDIPIEYSVTYPRGEEVDGL